MLFSLLKKRLSLGALSLLTLAACTSGTETTPEPTPAPSPTALLTFNADTAYDYVAKQVAFGPRVPGSKAQQSCAAWLGQMLRQSCDTVYTQNVTVKGGDGKSLPCINLVGSFNPAAEQRYLLLAHWDSRPWADMDTQNQDKPIDAADDGGSGVAVLLELARQFRNSPLPSNIGVDLLLIDVEDYGKTEWGDNSYGLGTQYWAANKHVPGYTARGGILLDMVGAAGARFPMEQTSREAASDLQDKLWQTANQAGYSSYFPFEAGGGVTDDHTFVNSIARIPTIDVIHLTRTTPTGFPAHWHTHKDAMPVIDRATLGAVGNTVLLFLRQL
jgi:hypothetical protein